MEFLRSSNLWLVIVVWAADEKGKRCKKETESERERLIERVQQRGSNDGISSQDKVPRKER